MADVAELIFEVGGLERITADLKKMNEDVGKLADNVKWGFVGDQIGKLADHFDGLEKAEMKAGEAIIKGFAAGGPWGAALAGANGLIQITIDYVKILHETENRAANAVKEQQDVARVAIAAANAERAKAVANTAALNLAARSGMTVAEATLSIQRKAVETEIALQQAIRARQLQQIVSEKDAGVVLTVAKQLEQTEALIKTGQARLGTIEAQGEEQRAQARQQAAEARRAAEKANAQKLYDDFLEWESKRLAAVQQAADREAAARRTHESLVADRAIKAAQDAADRERSWEEKKAAQAQRMAAADVDLVANAANEKIAADAEWWKARGEEMDKDAAQELANREAMVNAGAAAARSLFDMATGEEEVTKAKLEAKAKQAAIEAAFNGAVALAQLAVGNVQGAVTAGLAAAQFAAIAGGAGIMSTGASNRGASRPGRDAESPRTDSAPSRDRGTSATTINVVLPSGSLYPTQDEMLRATRAAQREAARRR